MEQVQEFTYLGARVSAGGGCEADVRECGQLLNGRRFPLMLKEALYESYVRPAILYGSEGWCMKESDI